MFEDKILNKKSRTEGLSNGVNIPLLGMGTWGMGGKYKKDPSNIDESVKILRAGLDMGIKLIDVAELYGLGLTEEIVGEAIAGYAREDIFIISKVWKTNLRYDDVLKAMQGSLERLKTDYVDFYLIHWPSEEIPLSETMRAMERLADEGLARDIGVSNFSVELLKEAQSHLKHAKIAANQIEYSLIERSAEKDVIPYCKENGIKVIAYRPLARGNIASSQNKALEALAQKYNKTPAQIALNWITSKEIVAIPKAGSIAHLRENCGALGWKMSEADYIAL